MAEGLLSGRILSNGQFVYGPNVGDFSLALYLQGNAPHLVGLAESLYGRADYFSINPKVYLTLFEVTAHLLADPDPDRLADPFGLDGDFITQVDRLSETLVNAYYLHLYTYSQLPANQRILPGVISRDGVSLAVDPAVNAGSYAIMAGLAKLVNADQLPGLLNVDHPAGFFQTWLRLFPGDDPRDESNHIYHPGEISAVGAPNELLQLPYPVGESWKPNGVHDAAGGGDGTPFTDGASIDFSPTWPAWNTDTSNMWVVAAASGTPNRISSCSFRISHADGWATSYYHLDNIQSFSGWINRNDRIGILANTYAQATCNGGFSTGPHLHFSLRHNGALVSIDGTPLSGWYVHAGRWNYDFDRSYFWLERDGVKSFAFQPLLSEAQLLITRVVSGGAHTCALTDRGTIKCWGENGDGQLGDGTTQDRLTPVDVQGLPAPAIKIAAGSQHTCALLNDGSVMCWGDNGDGQLGDGSTNDSDSPQAVSGLSSGVTGITAGGGHTCALSADGSVKCWGKNDSGQLGSGNNDPALEPVPVRELSTVVQSLAAGFDHTCSLDINGAVQMLGKKHIRPIGEWLHYHQQYTGPGFWLDQRCDRLIQPW